MLIIGEWDGRVDEIAQGDERSGSRNMDSGGVCPTLNAFDNATETRATVIITFSHTQGLDIQASESVTPTLRTEGGGMAAMNSQGVRRLTPLECERLQGFPDNWTAEQADSNRYKQMGNAITVNVAHYIGTLIMENSNE
jgi:DNA (cytosine-5)-methyltransferase 1